MTDIAIYSGQGAFQESLENFHQLFVDSEYRLHKVYSNDFEKLRLQSFSLVILPGGRGSQICQSLSEQQKQNFRDYIFQGGNVIGICAGAYALSSGYSWSLKITPVVVLDTQHWRRGEKKIKISLTQQGQKIFDSLAIVDTHYYNGPIISIPKTKYLPLAFFAEEICHPKGVRGIMQGSLAALVTQYGNGQVMSWSPHFEETEGQKKFLTNSVKFLIKNPNSVDIYSNF